MGDEAAADDLVGRRVEDGDQLFNRLADRIAVRIKVVPLVVVAAPSAAGDAGLEEVEDVGARELRMAAL
jgi:hypothetical protein